VVHDRGAARRARYRWHNVLFRMHQKQTSPHPDAER
jgi:hypothetical protein